MRSPFVPSWLQQIAGGMQTGGLETLQVLPGANQVRGIADVMGDLYSAKGDAGIADQFLGAEYVPNSGIGGALAMGLQAFVGKNLRDKSDKRISDLLREEFDIQSKTEREALERAAAKAQAEFDRKAAAARKAGHSEGAAIAIAEGVPLPKEKDAYDRWLSSQSPEAIDQAFKVKAGLAARPGSGTSVNIAGPESEEALAIRMGWMTPDEARIKFRRDQGLELPLKDQLAADADAAKSGQRSDAALNQAGDVLQTVREARGLVGPLTAGVGGVLSRVPGTDARDLQAKLTTIKANLGFDKLQQMREMSPTGGALGQVAVQELESLQATVASLDQLQSGDELIAALDKIDRHYTRWQQAVMRSRPQGSQPGEIIPNSQRPRRSVEEILRARAGG